MNTFEYTEKRPINPTQLVKRNSVVKAVCAGLVVAAVAVGAYVQLTNDNVVAQAQLIEAQRALIVETNALVAKQAEMIAAQEKAIKIERAKGVMDKASDNIKSFVAYVTN